MKKIKSSIKTKINAELKNYDSVTSNEEKAKSLTLIGKELNMELAIDKQENDNARTSEQIKTEKARQKLEAERLKIEKERKKEETELNIAKFNLEKEKAENEKFWNAERFAEEKKHNRNQLIISIVGIAVPALLTIVSKCIYAGLAFNAQKHDYKDYVMESKYSKEQRDNLNK